MAIDILVRVTVNADEEADARMLLETILEKARLPERFSGVDSWALLHEHTAVRIDDGARILRVAEETEGGAEPADRVVLDWLSATRRAWVGR